MDLHFFDDEIKQRKSSFKYPWFTIIITKLFLDMQIVQTIESMASIRLHIKDKNMASFRVCWAKILATLIAISTALH